MPLFSHRQSDKSPFIFLFKVLLLHCVLLLIIWSYFRRWWREVIVLETWSILLLMAVSMLASHNSALLSSTISRVFSALVVYLPKVWIYCRLQQLIVYWHTLHQLPTKSLYTKYEASSGFWVHRTFFYLSLQLIQKI